MRVWRTKPGQEHVLSCSDHPGRLVEEALASRRGFCSEQGRRRWAPCGTVQWDPERSVRGGKLVSPFRFRYGLGRWDRPKVWVNEWTVGILAHLTTLVGRLRRFREDGEWSRITALLPPEHPYPASPFAPPAPLGMPDAALSESLHHRGRAAIYAPLAKRAGREIKGQTASLKLDSDPWGRSF
jgi:hypothetical protein